MGRRRIGVITARFNRIVTERLQKGALEILHSAQDVDVIAHEVPGSFELPLAAKWLIEKEKLDAVVCLGAVIRGGTAHFDYVCSSCASGLMQVQLSTGRPVGFGVLTCDSLEQALDRADGKMGNKGEETAAAVLAMTRLELGIGTNN